MREGMQPLRKELGGFISWLDSEIQMVSLTCAKLLIKSQEEAKKKNKEIEQLELKDRRSSENLRRQESENRALEAKNKELKDALLEAEERLRDADQENLTMLRNNIELSEQVKRHHHRIEDLENKLVETTK
jgi:predicted RNase H-like nuclease (RuvC/YqgF family)